MTSYCQVANTQDRVDTSNSIYSITTGQRRSHSLFNCVNNATLKTKVTRITLSRSLGLCCPISNDHEYFFIQYRNNRQWHYVQSSAPCSRTEVSRTRKGYNFAMFLPLRFKLANSKPHISCISHLSWIISNLHSNLHKTTPWNPTRKTPGAPQ